MNWRIKAALAKAVAALPRGLSYRIYYCLQRHFGALRTADPVRGLKGGVAMVDLITRDGRRLEGGETFLEIGTGWSLTVPFALWLCGAGRIITVDLNRYLKPALVFEEIEYIKQHQETVTRLFGRYSQQPVFRERFEQLVNRTTDFDQLLAAMQVQYVAPANAGRLAFPCRSIDYHISFMVLQHVRPEALVDLFREGRRLLKADGLFVHYANLADLFAGVDHSISPVNFLRFSEDEWESFAGNRYMYHNRLRVDELGRLIESTGARIRYADTWINPESLRRLNQPEFVLAQRFKGKPPETNATEKIWLVAQSGEEPVSAGADVRSL